MHTLQRKKKLKIISLFLTTIVLLTISCGDKKSNDTLKIKTPLEKFHDMKFGMFIHWGLYSIPAGEWKGEYVRGIGEWIMYNRQIPVKDYEQLAEKFNPVKFNADEWSQLARDAGMKYMVITSKHHDGFAMYHSKVSDYNIIDRTPFKRDPIKELAQSNAKYGIKFGFYYSQAQDWHAPGGAGHWDEVGPGEEWLSYARFYSRKTRSICISLYEACSQINMKLMLMVNFFAFTWF